MSLMLHIKHILFTALFFIVLPFLVSPVSAQEQSAAISRNTFNKLTQIETLIGGDHIDEALKKVDKLISKLPKRAADRSYIYLAKANILLRQENYAGAEKFFLASDQQKGLTKASSDTVALTLANLSLHSEKYRQAISYFERYRASIETPAKEALYGLATAYYQTQQYRQSIAPLNEALTHYKTDKNIFLMLFSAHYELEELSQAANVLERIVRHWPDEPSYWIQLASIYVQSSNTAKAISTFESAYQIDKLLSQSDILQFTYQLNAYGVPYKAASLLENALKDKVVSSNEKHLKLLGSLYLESGEEILALERFELASQYAKRGNTDFTIAQLHYARGNYKKAINHAQLALQKGTSKAGNIYMLLASLHHSLGDTNHTREYLVAASKHKETRKSSKRWLASLSSANQ